MEKKSKCLLQSNLKSLKRLRTHTITTHQSINNFLLYTYEVRIYIRYVRDTGYSNINSIFFSSRVRIHFARFFAPEYSVDIKAIFSRFVSVNFSTSIEHIHFALARTRCSNYTIAFFSLFLGRAPASPFVLIHFLVDFYFFRRHIFLPSLHDHSAPPLFHTQMVKWNEKKAREVDSLPKIQFGINSRLCRGRGLIGVLRTTPSLVPPDFIRAFLCQFSRAF